MNKNAHFVDSPLACENIRFSSLFVAGDVSRRGTPPRETSPAAKSEEKRMFSQANSPPTDAGHTIRDG